MKAIIMAGGEGTRLRPVSSGIPKPMVPILERPALEHIVELLRESGITEICITLGYMPDSIISYFGDGSRFGVKITHRVEKVALGTAGGVRACMDFIGDEDFLVISGDAACDFDLCELIDYHNYYKPAVTMALFSHPEPLQYGLVLTSPDGAVRSFIEKPTWDRVITDSVNTGIYIIRSGAMNHVPLGEFYDFARDMFPKLMMSGYDIRAVALDGYWCDIGNPTAYLRCTMDALEGKLRAVPGVQQIIPGVWSGSELPRNVKIVPPCVIGEGVIIEQGAVIGPKAVIGRGSHVGPGARIRSSVINGAAVGPDADINGAVVCRGARVPEDMVIEPGEVIAPPDAKYPPDTKAEPNAHPIAEKMRERHQSTRARMPYFRELNCTARARVMRALSESLVEFGADFTDGLQLNTEFGKVRISPSPENETIVVEADAGIFSKDLCSEYENIVRSYVEDEEN